MPLYLVGNAPGMPGAGADHQHAQWETPIDQGDRQNFRVTKANYVPNSLDVAISAESDGEEGFTVQFPPVYIQINPNTGLFRLSDELPVGWKIIVRYIYH